MAAAYMDENYKPKPINFLIGNIENDGCGNGGFETEEEAIKYAKRQAQRNPGSLVGVFKLTKKILPPEPTIEDITN